MHNVGALEAVSNFSVVLSQELHVKGPYKIYNWNGNFCKQTETVEVTNKE